MNHLEEINAATPEHAESGNGCEPVSNHTKGKWTASRMLICATEKDRRSGFVVNGPDADPLPVSTTYIDNGRMIPNEEFNRDFFSYVTPGGNPHSLTRKMLCEVFAANGIEEHPPTVKQATHICFPGGKHIVVRAGRIGRRNNFYVTAQ